MVLWVDMGKSIVGLKEKLINENVYLQTELEFNLIHDLANENYRYIRLGYATMTKEMST